MKFSPAYYWPHWLNSSLSEKKSKLIKYQRAQEQLWQALNIYDDFFDGSGQAVDLPQANIYYRNFLKTFYLSNTTEEFKKIGDKIIHELDLANKQEIKYHRINWKNSIPKLPKNMPDFSQLAHLSKKSLALALLPIAAISMDKKVNEKILVNFFRYALAAKQLSDDAKDWLEDLLAGKLTAVTFLVVQEGQKQKIKKHLYQKTAILHLLFAQGAAIPTCHNILKLCSLARKEASKLGIKEQAPIIKNLVLPLEKASHKSLRFSQLLSS